ncbi:MAG: glucosamine-6-phosphate deaminase [Eubacteriaceae bacterium]|nr:glucosamine-6-phosphate deaminase [Eubacteriaceae bacterium]
MKLYRAENYEHMSRKGANIVSAQVIMKPDCTLGLATGSTPVGMYRQLISWYEKGDLDFSEVRSINLDEYVGLKPDDKNSYRYFMNDNLFDHVNIDKANTHVPNGMAGDIQAECDRYNGLLRQNGGIDMQVLGIGRNGHIGFNEPGDAFEKETCCIALTQSTLDANARYFDSVDAMPHKAITMGIKSIMQSKSILLLVSGENKAEALYNSFWGPVTPKVPASILQLHNNVTIVADDAAMALVDKKTGQPVR